MTFYYIDKWVEVERFYRNKCKKDGRLGFIPIKAVREWIDATDVKYHGIPSEAYRYQPVWSVLRNEILNRDGYICQVCGKDVSGKYVGNGMDWSKAEIDHIQPIALGGLEFDINNLRVTCKECNTKNRPNAILKLKFDASQGRLI